MIRSSNILEPFREVEYRRFAQIIVSHNMLASFGPAERKIDSYLLAWEDIISPHLFIQFQEKNDL